MRVDKLMTAVGLQALRLAAASAKERRSGGHLAAAGMPISPAAEARQV